MSTKPFLPVAAPSIGQREIRYVSDAVRSGWVSSIGAYVKRFEEGFGKFCHTPYAIALANGTVALHLALRTLDVGPGDEVILPSLTFVATANAVTYCGATPVFVDSNPVYWCMDPASIQAAITPRTKAIIAVHLYGHPCDMDAIRAIARKYRLKVIEDAAEAHGAEFCGHRVGALSDIGVFSFYGNKIMTTGEGGALVTHSPKLALKASHLKDHAMSPTRRYWHDQVGFNYRMTNLQAALGVAQLERIHELLKIKEGYARQYRELLSDVKGIRLNPKAPWAKNVYWLVCLDLRQHQNRTIHALLSLFKQLRIDSRPFFVPMHRLPMYRQNRAVNTLSKKKGCPVADDLSRKCLNLPSGYGLATKDIERVCQAIRKVCKA